MKNGIVMQTLICLLVASCSINELDTRNDLVTRDDVFYASLESYSDPDTKVYVDENVKILWDEDDRVTIFNKYTYNQEYRFLGETGDNAGGFRKVPNDDFITGNDLDHVYAVYPYLESTKISNEEVMTITLPSEQVYRNGSFGPGANVMTSATEDNMLRFKNVGGYLVLKFYGEGVSVSSIKLEGNNGELLSGKATVTHAVEGVPSVTMATDAGTSITLNCPTPVELGATKENATIFWLVVPPTKFTGGFTLTVTDVNGNEFVKETTTNLSIARNGVLRISPIEVTISATTIDLSANGSANSYIVSKVGSYMFNCMVQGNSTSAIPGVPSSAEVLWETFNTKEQPSVGDVIKNVRYENGFICFDTSSPFHEGNALIAIKSKEDKILWSWHIWVTSADIESLAQEYPHGVGVMMDRNLGALTAESTSDLTSYGFYYQWGRKDPFFYFTQAESTGKIEQSVSAQSVGGDQDNGAKSIAYAIEHPTTFITWNGYNYDWCYGFNPLENYDNTRWGSSKTKYDPCPPGWRVPDGGTDGFWVVSGLDSFKPDSFTDNGGLLLAAADVSENDIYYPAGGYLSKESGSLYENGEAGYCWASSGSSVYANSFSVHNYDVYGAGGQMRSNGLNVRCVREDSHHAADRPSDHSSTNMSSSEYSVLGVYGGKANCYIIFSTTQNRYFSFLTYKGNSSTLLNDVASAEVLWESSGTDEIISPGTIISDISYYRNLITFKLPDTVHTGNALIAAKNSEGVILWSWHIWITDGLGYNYYPNSAGVVMNRNLGAIAKSDSYSPNAGMAYQWGRKDPFLDRYHYNFEDDDDYYITSTITWPSVVSPSIGGTIEYSIAHPTTIITNNNYDTDWLTTSDNTLWSSTKTIYDPCPSGWHVPNGGENGLWAKAGFPASLSDNGLSVLSSTMSSYFDGTTYPPTSGDGDHRYGSYWSATAYSNTQAFLFHFSAVYDEDEGYRVKASSQSQGLKKGLGAVRCVR
jgi:hypothetical protein